MQIQKLTIDMKKISVVTPCYNEEENVLDLYLQIKEVFECLKAYSYEHIFIDNASTDQTIAILREIAEQDKHVKVIVNVRNFGHIRSPYHAIFQASGDAVVILASDLQDPPDLIPQFLQKWEEGYPVVMGVKEKSEESPLFFFLRTLYYRVLAKLSDVQLIEHFTGFGLYDRQVVEVLRKLNDAYPYFRGLIADLGFSRAVIPYNQPQRKRGITKNNFYTLYDMAMLGMTNHSKVPLRLAAMLGFVSSIISLLVALFYLIYKLLFWSEFALGLAPLVVGLFFFASVQLFFLGIVGEYVGAIYTQVLKRPLVIERERINFDA
jgi:glycosyltransferase involved in cell wall biosynthesis